MTPRPPLTVVHDRHLTSVDPDDDVLREQARHARINLASRPIEEKVSDMREAWARGYASEREPQQMVVLLTERLGRLAYHVANMKVLARESDRERERQEAVDEACLTAAAVIEVASRLDAWPPVGA